MATKPITPTAQRIDQITSTSLRYLWISNGDGGSPILEWQIGWGTDPNIVQNSFTTAGSPQAITGLAPGWTYYFWVRARNAIAWGPYSNRLSATMLAVPGPPNVSVSSITSDSAYLSVSAPGYNGGSAVDSYESHVMLNGSEASTGSGSYSATGLEHAIYYTYSARAHNAIGWSAWASAQGFTTLPVIPQPPGLGVDSITDTSARLVPSAPYDNGGENVSNYYFEVVLNGTVVSNGYGFSFIAYGLQPRTDYTCTVQAYNSAGWSNKSSAESFTTRNGPPGIPTNYPLKDITFTGMTFQIDDGDDGGSSVTERHCQYTTDPNFSSWATVDLDSSGLIVFTNFSPSVTYYFRGYVVTATGTSPFTAIISATTLSGVLVKDQGVFKKAIPYVNVNGVWKQAVPYVKVNGIWELTSP